MQKTAADLYEAVFLETPNEDFVVPANLIGGMSSVLTTINERNTEHVLLPRMSLLYVLEYFRIYIVGGVTCPYACMEWPRIQTPQALITLLEY
jgi:hypothetical protein